MDAQQMKERTAAFALRIVRLVRSLPRDMTCQIIGRQLLKAGTSVAANYRAACRARSKPEFVAKMGIVEEEADESLFWMELLARARIVEQAKLNDIMKEANEIVSIVVSSKKTARTRNRR